MAGSLKHCLTEEGTYRGVGLLDHMGDAEEAIEQMVFMILRLRSRWGGDMIVQELTDAYFKCARGEEPWPDFMRPGIERR